MLLTSNQNVVFDAQAHINWNKMIMAIGQFYPWDARNHPDEHSNNPIKKGVHSLLNELSKYE